MICSHVLSILLSHVLRHSQVIAIMWYWSIWSHSVLTAMYRVGRPIGRKVLKVMFWEVPPACGPLL